jgi:hypothetical protein
VAAAGGDITYLRFAFGGAVGFEPERPLDDGIVRAVWLTLDELGHARASSQPADPAVLRGLPCRGGIRWICCGTTTHDEVGCRRCLAVGGHRPGGRAGGDLFQLRLLAEAEVVFSRRSWARWRRWGWRTAVAERAILAR